MIGVPQKVTHSSVRFPLNLGKGIWAFHFQPCHRFGENLYLAFDWACVFLSR